MSGHDFEGPRMRAALDTWIVILDHYDTPDTATIVDAVCHLTPAYATVNTYEVRDAVVKHLWANPSRTQYDRLNLIAHYVTEPDALAEVHCLAGIAALNVSGHQSIEEAWAANGALARTHLNAALTNNPGHNLARVLLQQGDRLQHVSGGVA